MEKCNFMCQENLISIIMPAYNCEKTIGDSINSVIKQTYKNLELIVIDDGSSDDTVKIVERFIQQDKRINLLKNETNLGVSTTRNKGISSAVGEWIAFLDADDIWEETKLEKQMKCVRETTSDFIFTGVSYINEKDKPFKGIFEVPSQISYQKLLRQNVITCSSVLIKKNFFDSIKMEKDEMHEDYAVWLRILKTGVIAYGINEPLLIYRISSKSKSGNKIKTVKMTFQVYRSMGENPINSIYFMVNHIFRSIKKYIKIIFLSG